MTEEQDSPLLLDLAPDKSPSNRSQKSGISSEGLISQKNSSK